LVFDIQEELGQKVFENRVLRRIFGPKRDEVVGDWRKLHQVMENEMSRACSTHVGEALRVLDFGGKAGRKETTMKT
jgi:hypothetical protein